MNGTGAWSQAFAALNQIKRRLERRAEPAARLASAAYPALGSSWLACRHVLHAPAAFDSDLFECHLPQVPTTAANITAEVWARWACETVISLS